MSSTIFTDISFRKLGFVRVTWLNTPASVAFDIGHLSWVYHPILWNSDPRELPHCCVLQLCAHRHSQCSKKTKTSGEFFQNFNLCRTALSTVWHFIYYDDFFLVYWHYKTAWTLENKSRRARPVSLSFSFSALSQPIAPDFLWQLICLLFFRASLEVAGLIYWKAVL